MRRVSFTAMADGTPADFRLIADNDAATQGGLADRLLEHLELGRGDDGACRVDRLVHALQCAHRAELAGVDDDWVFAALLHDVGDTLAPDNHAVLAEAIVAPYVRPEVAWTVRRHGEVQGHYYWAHIGRDGRARERHRDHPWFEHAVAFCHLFDQSSFDPDHDTPDLERFRPLVERVCGREPWSRTEPRGPEALGVDGAGRASYRAVLEAREPR